MALRRIIAMTLGRGTRSLRRASRRTRQLLRRPVGRLFRRILWLTALCFVALAGVQCASAPAAAPQSADLAASCAAFDGRPVRRVTYAYVHDPFQKSPSSASNNIGKLQLDDARPGLTTDDAAAMAVHRAVRAADLYFRGLQARGLGTWDGCYGKAATQPILTSIVHHPALTGFQGKAFSETIYRDDQLSDMDVAREVAQGLVDRNVYLDVTSVQTAAVWVSLADTFAALATGQYEFRTADGGLRRSLSNPPDPNASAPGLDHFSAYLGANPYFDAGILNKAFFLTVNGGVHPPAAITKGGVTFQPVEVQGIGKTRAEAVYFHALNPRFIPESATIRDLADGVEAACRDLAGSAQPHDITAAHCDEVRNAFRAVGVLPAAPPSAAN